MRITDRSLLDGLGVKKREYKYQTPNGRAPYDREKERAINKRLAEELAKPKAKKEA